eukprot:GEMP01000535.1.p1 GENE.GEMP01000535.1~~GEMP01000535.1.p1  ORF type:complete len:1693 (+),score=408.54 GEMP01000535.1:315-5393(+)
MSSFEYVWVPHEELVWTPARLKCSKGNNLIYIAHDKSEVVIRSSDQASLLPVTDGQLSGVDNIVTLECVTPGALLHTVRTRYLKNNIYSNVSHIVIAVNPFQPLSIYSSKHIDMYARATDSLELPPHVFGIGADAFRGLMDDRNNQAILVSGESGAGKTESTKLVLSYLAEVAGHDGNALTGIEDKILQTNPVLEAFGNAKTLRNDNSSRFGKWIEVVFHPSMRIVGSRILDYLLEMTRVCSQAFCERNYHVFYYLLAANPDPTLDLGVAADYRYLQEGAEDVSSAEEKDLNTSLFTNLQIAMKALNFSPAEQSDLYSIVAGILHLGNCTFTNSDLNGADGSTLVSDKPLATAARIMGLDAEKFKLSLMWKRIVVGKEVTDSPLSPQRATVQRDILAKLIYGNLFKWLVRKLNLTLVTKEMIPGKNWNYIGILDIAGFEQFKVNSLEQLFINLSNEELQMHFNNHVFAQELADYKTEGVVIDKIDFRDNSECVELLAGKHGILAMLDDELAVPKASDRTYTEKAWKRFGDHEYFQKPKFPDKSEFSIVHFAGTVTYRCDGWMEKNSDNPSPGAVELLSKSSISILRDIANSIDEQNPANSRTSIASSARPKKAAVSQVFRASLKSLVAKVTTAHPHFIRCIKPNNEKLKDKFESVICMEQLMFSGVMEAVKIRQAGYPLRMEFSDFVRRFGCTMKSEHRNEIRRDPQKSLTQNYVKKIVATLPVKLGAQISVQDFAVGKNKIFCKRNAQKGLEQYRRFAYSGASLIIQRNYRGFIERKHCTTARKIYRALNQWMDNNDVYARGLSALGSFSTPEDIERSCEDAEVYLQEGNQCIPVPPNLGAVRRIVQRMMKELELVREIAALGDSMEIVEIEKKIAQARDLAVTGDIIDDLAVRATRLKVQLPIFRALEALDLQRGEERLGKFQQVLAACEAANLKGMKDWLSGLENGFEYQHATQQRVETIEREIHEAKLAAEKRSLEAKDKEERQRLDAERLEAEKAFLEKKKKDQRDVRRETITGMKETDQEKLLENLKKACVEYDVVQLELLLREALQNAIPAEHLTECETLFKQLQTENFLATEIKRITSESVPTTDELKRLQNLARQWQKLGLSEEMTASSIRSMQQGVRQRAERMNHKSVFHAQDNAEEALLAMGAFDDLSKFSGLVDPSRWKGTRGSGFGRILHRSRDNMLSHSKQKIVEPLTKGVPSNLVNVALQNFRNILGWMKDKVVQDCRRRCLAYDVVNTAKSHPALRDEIYVQVMKQLTNNPMRPSEILGWTMLWLLCQEAAPSGELVEFVRAFMKKKIALQGDPEMDEIIRLANQCLVDLDTTVAQEKGEIGTVNDEMISVTVQLMDETARKVFISKRATLTDLGNKMPVVLNISLPEDFSFFQLTDGLDTHRLLPDHAVISQLLDKWSKLFEATKRSSRLVWKRRFLRADESLHTADFAHATLTYHQSVWEYLHYPIQEDPMIIAQVAAAIVSLKRSQYGTDITQAKLQAPGALESLVPEQMLQYQPRKQWAKTIVDYYPQFADVDREFPIQKMNRALGYMQRMRLFGAYYWIAHQVMSISPADLALSDMPPSMLKINPRRPEAEYWVCVDMYGIRFVTVDHAPGGGGKDFQRGFLYSETAMERLLRWGAKKNVLQLVVQCVNPQEPSRGRGSLTIALVCPAAIDVAYAIHRISSESQHLSYTNT